MNNDPEKINTAISYLLLLGKYIPGDTTFSEMCGDVLIARDLEGRVIEASPWQAIETAPKDGTWILLTGGTEAGDEPIGPCIVGSWREGDWAYCYWESGWGSAYENPTHWMFLPEGPK